ncbi:hypothetical protein AQZ52_03930 [Novosphingobium fuchskuhlense]|uniref:Secreted protein n=1 Tax=Novosphingobium fuchskuhlense TaxID=1117702 RepID=A0A117UX13_9SPHN|nr:hypothetical protein [Novosphingobium fuchskuhlense]KUR72417.1 hypothetical protein AQZ52_03930 [Novosphingobium fuchskuhlense]
MIATRHSLFAQLLPAVLALVGTATTFVATAGPARAADGYYSVTLAAPVAKPAKLMLGDVLWNCAGDTCSAGQDTARPVVVCTKLAAKVGTISRFATPKGELAAEDMARCNTPKG